MRIVIPLVLLVLAVGLSAVGAAQPSAPDGGPGAAPPTESLDDVQVVHAPIAEGRPAGLGDLVGRLHPALVHFPIAWLIALLVIDLVGLVLKHEPWQRWGYWALIGAGLSLIPTVPTGFLRAAYLLPDPAVRQALVVHRTLNLVVTGLVVVALALRVLRRNRLGGAVKVGYLALVVLAAGLVLVAAGFGGKMVYGPNFLPF
jgi:uncharacterized membrane protein